LVIELLRKTQATHANIDTVGIGKGMVDRGREQDFKFEPISVGEKADDKDRFLNRRAELWWGVRELFEKGEIDIDAEDDDLAAELVSLRFERQSNGKIKIESKKEAEARGVPSPNRAEALMLACAKARKKITKATWGRAA
jgi:phage terminase large subunit